MRRVWPAAALLVAGCGVFGSTGEGGCGAFGSLGGGEPRGVSAGGTDDVSDGADDASAPHDAAAE